MKWLVVGSIALLVLALIGWGMAESRWQRENQQLTAACRGEGRSAYECATDSAKRVESHSLSQAASLTAGAVAGGAMRR